MSLVLSVTNVERLDNGSDTQLRLDRHGAVIGRSPTADWSLPDPQNYISSIHCEIDYRDGAYWFTDRSTNGTFLNGSKERMVKNVAVRIADGDELAIGCYRVRARIVADGAPAAAPTPVASPESDRGWRGWEAPAPPPPPLRAGMGFEAPPPPPPPPAPPVSAWQSEAAANTGGWAPEPAGGRGSSAPNDDDWTSPRAPITGSGAANQGWAPPPPAPSAAANNIWARLEQSSQVDWGRGGFSNQWDPAAPAAPMSEPSPPPAPAAVSPGETAWMALLAAAGLEASDIGPPGRAGATAGGLLRRLVAGLVVMLEARARAKVQLGAQGTAFSPDGNNPLKFTRTPGQALSQLLGPPERGYLAADQAVDDAFKDLQAHQMATLAAMQGALRATLDRFSPRAIRERAEDRGLLAKIIPGAREAALWRAYEREFEGVVQGSDEAFMDVFAQAFRDAYERAAGGRGRW